MSKNKQVYPSLLWPKAVPCINKGYRYEAEWEGKLVGHSLKGPCHTASSMKWNYKIVGIPYSRVEHAKYAPQLRELLLANDKNGVDNFIAYLKLLKAEDPFHMWTVGKRLTIKPYTTDIDPKWYRFNTHYIP